MEIRNVKGTIDYLPEEEMIKKYVNDILKNTFEDYGYLPIETPILCYYDMLIGKYDSNNDLVKEIYKVSDQGNRELGLRYDLTVPFAKFIALNKNKISIPFKRYEISKVFRDGPIKLGRDREFTQCDVDVVGIKGEYIEAECMDLYVKAFNKMNINIEIRYNSRNLLRGLILDCDVKEKDVNKVITIVDKMNKLSKDELYKAFNDIGVSDDKIDNLFKLFSLNLDKLNDKYKDSDNELISIGIKEVSNLNKYLKELEIDKYCVFDSTLARGQDYYTGIVCEVFDKDKYVTSSIGGGGRYDNMITNYIDDGNIYPAMGISFGLSSIYEILKNKKVFDNNNLIDLYIVPMDTEIDSLKLASKLREKGLRVLVELNKRRVGKCLDWANRNNIPYVIVLGENEIMSGKLEIRDMVNSRNIESNIDDVEDIIKLIGF